MSVYYDKEHMFSHIKGSIYHLLNTYLASRREAAIHVVFNHFWYYLYRTGLSVFLYNCPSVFLYNTLPSHIQK